MKQAFRLNTTSAARAGISHRFQPEAPTWHFGLDANLQVKNLVLVLFRFRHRLVFRTAPESEIQPWVRYEKMLLREEKKNPSNRFAEEEVSSSARGAAVYILTRSDDTGAGPSGPFGLHCSRGQTAYSARQQTESSRLPSVWRRKWCVPNCTRKNTKCTT